MRNSGEPPVPPVPPEPPSSSPLEQARPEAGAERSSLLAHRSSNAPYRQRPSGWEVELEVGSRRRAGRNRVAWGNVGRIGAR